MRHRASWHATRAKNCSDKGHRLFLNSTCDIGDNKWQGKQHCQFLKSTCDIGDPPSRAPRGAGDTAICTQLKSHVHCPQCWLHGEKGPGVGLICTIKAPHCWQPVQWYCSCHIHNITHYRENCFALRMSYHINRSFAWPQGYTCIPPEGPLMSGPQCRMSILRNGNTTCPCRLFSPMSHVTFKKKAMSHVTIIF